jgi:hypothetical protein
LDTVRTNWNRAWKNAAHHVSGPTVDALLGHREDINLPEGGIGFFPFFGNGWDYVKNVGELPSKLASVINRERPTIFDETLYFHAAPSTGGSNSGGRAWVSIEDAVALERGLGMNFRITSLRAWPADMEFDVEVTSDTANRHEDLGAVDTRVTLYAGQLETRLTIPIIDDLIREGSERFFVRLIPRQLGTLMRRDEAMGTILDNDPVTTNGPPIITRQPLAANGILGEAVVVDVAALGAGLKYQWAKNGKCYSTSTLSDTIR